MTKPINLSKLIVGSLCAALLTSCGASSSGSANTPDPNNIPPLEIPLPPPIASFDISIDKTEFTVSDNAIITIIPNHDEDARHITQLSTKGNNSVTARPDEAADINAYFTAREIQLSATGELQIEFSTDIMSTFKLNVSTYLENDLTTVISSQNYIITVADTNGEVEELITTPSIKLYNDSRFTVTGYKLASSSDSFETSDITSVDLLPGSSALIDIDDCEKQFIQFEKNGELHTYAYLQIQPYCDELTRISLSDENLIPAYFKISNRSITYQITGYKLALSEDALDDTELTVIDLDFIDSHTIELANCDSFFLELELERGGLLFSYTDEITPRCNNTLEFQFDLN